MKDVNLLQLVWQYLREAVSETKTVSNFDTNSGMVFFMVSTIMATGKPAPILDFCGLFTIEWNSSLPVVSRPDD